MQKFSNPLDNIKIASPCGANWNEMIGNNRKRYCAECKLNVYNLSDMTREEAENFLINSEGRVCLRIFRRNDGTVLTQDCPVGWAKIKRKISRMATAALAMFAGIFSGVFTVEFLQPFRSKIDQIEISEPLKKSNDKISFGITEGILENLPEIKADIFKNLNGY